MEGFDIDYINVPKNAQEERAGENYDDQSDDLVDSYEG